MKAWRLEAAAINKRIAEGSKEPRSRIRMQQQRMISRAFKPKGSGNWLLDGLLIKAGFKAAVYGDPIKQYDDPLNRTVAEVESFSAASTLQRWVDKAKAWWNKRRC